MPKNSFVAKNVIHFSRPTTPYGLEKSSASNPPPAPNSLPLSSFSTPLTGGGAGGGKLRSKVTGRGGPMDALENEEPPPPLPAFLTNNVPQLKVSKISPVPFTLVILSCFNFLT